MEAKELEEMEFPAHSYVPETFIRAILDKPGHPLFVSGITQLECSSGRNDEDPVPYDPLKARVGAPARLGNQYFAEYFAANLCGVDRNRAEGRRVGYRMHMPCWVLLCRLVGKQLIEENLDCFVATVKSFWCSEISNWNLKSVEGYYGTYRGIMPWSERQWIWPRYAGGRKPSLPEPWLRADSRENPGAISDIHQLIRNASLVPSQQFAMHGNHPVHNIPLDVAIIIVELIREEPNYDLKGVRTTKNLLTAFGWRLPNTYWQSHCRNCLVFEVEDLIQAGSEVDWQFLCLGLEELIFGHRKYFKRGLRNRGRIMQLIERIKESFLVRLKASSASKEE
ncbi:uncharacterized protein LDX57_005260 [Aspergillus melleus]|uniref:uncharacterized protein n=1 Tax=Aspergillus melleus TaxID=138277 RepID=UPI001E8CFF63|nr:uncharacterized protein LDX57_005260 [Aspergillus melleus]KAH8427547.1 hypothetical protein LDX57_005260 [Aspergillus melleus]